MNVRLPFQRTWWLVCLLAICMALLPALALSQTPGVSEDGPALTTIPGYVSCTTTTRVRGTGFEPGTQVIVSPGGIDAAPGTVFEAYAGPVTVTPHGTFDIYLEPGMFIYDCSGGPLGRDGASYQLTASTLTGNSDPNAGPAFGPPHATTAFRFAIDPDDPALTLSPDRGTGCMQVTAHGRNFEPGTYVTLFTGALGSHNFGAAVDESPLVADDGTFSATLDPRLTPFIDCDDAGTLPDDGARYLVNAVTGRGPKPYDEEFRSPQASDVFTVGSSPAASIQHTWARTDRPVAEGSADRTWMWGPEPLTDVITEPYAEAPGGARDVQYYDKARMEVTHPDRNPANPWHVTNGLLVVEMVEGRIQTGDAEWIDAVPADVNVAGDLDDPHAPTYRTIAANIEAELPHIRGQVISGVIDRQGWNEARSAEMGDMLATYNVTSAERSPETNKYTASVFWEFMNSTALVYEDGNLVNAPLFPNPYYATGLPIDHAWWTEVTVSGTSKWVLIQCFERRCLTYTPDNPPGWQIEAGNVGLHYSQWRQAIPEEQTPIAFVSNRSGTDDVWSVHPDGSNLRQLTNTADEDQTPVWSPDGTQIAFFRGAYHEQDFLRHVWVMNADGSDQLQITETPGSLAELSWSPDGRHLAYVERVDNFVSTLNVVQPDGSGHNVVTPDNMRTVQYDWSPDSSQFVVAGSVDDVRYSLFIVGADGSGLRPLTDTPLWGLTPSWSPDGSTIAYMLVADITEETHGIYVTNVDGSGTQRLAHVYPVSHNLVWSPDGRKLAFTAIGRQNTQIFVMHADGTNLILVSGKSPGENSVHPVWSPDSSRIAFMSYLHGGNQEIYTVNADGSGPTTNISSHPGWDRVPDWSHVGQ